MPLERLDLLVHPEKRATSARLVLADPLDHQEMALDLAQKEKKATQERLAQLELLDLMDKMERRERKEMLEVKEIQETLDLSVLLVHLDPEAVVRSSLEHQAQQGQRECQGKQEELELQDFLVKPVQAELLDQLVLLEPRDSLVLRVQRAGLVPLGQLAQPE